MPAAGQIVTARFLLRPLVPEDATERYSLWLDDAMAIRFIEAARRPHDVANLKAYIEARIGRRDVLFLGIFTRADGAHIGNIKYEPVDESAGYAVMGILIGEPAWRGRDIAAEVITASAQWLATHRNIGEFVLGVQRENDSAIRVYRQIGFQVDTSPHIAAGPETITMVWRPSTSRRSVTS